MIKIFFNSIFGLSIGIIISYIFISKQKYHGPNSKEVIKKIFKYNSKCYKLVPKEIKCSIFSFHD